MKKIISRILVGIICIGILAGIICIANLNSLNDKTITIEEYAFDSNFHNWNMCDYYGEEILPQTTVKIIGNLIEIDGPYIYYCDGNYWSISTHYFGRHKSDEQSVVQVGEHFFKADNGKWELKEVKYEEICVLSNGGHIFSFDFNLDTLYYFPKYIHGNEINNCYVGYYSSNNAIVDSTEFLSNIPRKIDFYDSNKSFIIFEDTEVQYYNETLSINNVEIDYKNCSCVGDSLSNVNTD